MKSKIKGQDVVEAVKRYHGYDISMRQAQRALTKLQPRQSRGSHAQVTDHMPPQASVPSSAAAAATVRVGNEAFDPLADDRGWPENGLSSALMEDDGNDSPSENTPAAIVHAQQNKPSLATLSHTQPGPADARDLSTLPHQQITSLTSTGQAYVHPISLPVSQPTPPTTTTSKISSQPQPPPPPPPHPPHHQQPAPQPGHPVAAQLVLTNFKIEFTCTSCGTLNQSFFPNQGNVTGNNYLPAAAAQPAHGLPAPTANGQPPTMDRVGSETTTATNAAGPAGFGEADYPGNATSHGRELPPWGGGLDVSIAPANS
ncbi:hypothetical protein UA08_03683 [Talaromyces atroroseus]|uniref:Clr5 domain-containing protein n=1 Tax=Talaromyces atroroseus TaxID=1441469 RepID=A0A225B3K5_TALAT|nr:hypothetical protein UA08_03683 [Talaromyces atroroseus]OKL61415.1 hypothetical protein UA08_03683 [Talaromyces atroroseus]